MNKKEVYKRSYSEKELNKYNKLVEFIKKNYRENMKWLDSKMYKHNYLDFDGNFNTITFIQPLSKNYNNSHYTAEIIIEKMGPDLTKLSEIENMLIKEGFKEEKLK